MKKKWLLVVAAILGALMLEIIQIYTQPRITFYSSTATLEEQEKTVALDQAIDFPGFGDVSDGTDREDTASRTCLSTEGFGTYRYVYFHFIEPLSKSGRFCVYYPGKEGYTEADCIRSNGPEGVYFWSVEVPAGEYPSLYIDFDGDFGLLNSIGVGNVSPEATKKVSELHPVRIIIVAVLLFAVLFWMSWCGIWTRMKKTVSGGIQAIRADGRKSVFYVLVFSATIGFSIFLFWLFYTVLDGNAMTSPQIVFAGIAGVFAACLFVFRKTLKTQPEYLFLILMLCIGFLYSFYVPHTGLNSWDEDIHYHQALKTSYVDSVVLSEQDEATIRRDIPGSFDLNGGIQRIHDRQDILNRNINEDTKTFAMIQTIPEVFNGIGLFIGRALGLRYYLIHFLGRFSGLFVYALLGFLAIRKLKSGKMIAVVVLMVPTEVFIASSFNYDCYLTGFTALGLCYYLFYWQDRNAKVSLKDAIIMIGSVSFGCISKPVYIPLIWILFLLPGNKFTGQKSNMRFKWSIVLGTGLVIFSYILPSLLEGIGLSDGDDRGGSLVSVRGQLAYILHNPLAYVRTIWDFLINNYFSPNAIGGLTLLAYHGVMPNQYIYLVLLAVVAFTDKNEHDKELVHRPWAHIVPIGLSLAVTVIVVTSMYLAFTPVGADYVSGAQFRYLIPMFLPVLLHIGSGLVQNKMNRAWYNGLVLGVAALVGFSCVYNGFICKYF